MNDKQHIACGRILRRAGVVAALALACMAVTAAPGAHGPNGEHLDEKTTVPAGAGTPSVEAKSEAFELVANLRGNELTILVDRYETNEPVLGARLEVESGAHKALATFRPEAGDYAVTDAALLKSLSAPGEHALVFTLTAGSDADLLDGTLVIAGAANASSDHDHPHGPGAAGHAHDSDLARAAWTGAGILGLGLVIGIAWWRQRRRNGVTSIPELRA
jgi:hypothetical protein